MTTDPELMHQLLVHTNEPTGGARSLAQALPVAGEDALTYERDLELIASNGVESKYGESFAGPAARGRW